jgi:hypothetical protein
MDSHLIDPTEISSAGSHLLLILTSRLGHGAMGVTHGGFVQINGESRPSKLKIAAKLAFTNDQQQDIYHEHDIYVHLASKGVCGIPDIRHFPRRGS